MLQVRTAAGGCEAHERACVPAGVTAFLWPVAAPGRVQMAQPNSERVPLMLDVQPV